MNRLLVSTFASVAMLSGSMAIADETTASGPAAEAPATPAAPATVAVPSAAPAADPAPSAPAVADVSSTTVLRPAVPPPSEFKPPGGYQKVTKGLETVYCKSYTPIGSRMPEKVCYSEAQLRAIIKRNEANQQEMREKANAGGTNAS